MFLCSVWAVHAEILTFFVVSITECNIQCESRKIPLGDLTFFHFFHKWLRICNRFFTHLLNVPIFARLQIFIQLSPILTKLCHIKHDYPVHIICAKCPKRACSDVDSFVDRCLWQVTIK